MHLGDIGTILALIGVAATILQRLRKKQEQSQAVPSPASLAVEAPVSNVAQPAATFMPPLPAIRPRPPVAPRAGNVPKLPDGDKQSEPFLVLDLFRQPQSLAAALVAGEILAPPVALRHNPLGTPGVLHQ